MALSDRQVVELFHLLLLRQLASGNDRARFVLKGGCNLRFFFGSIRYSEDMDLDTSNVGVDTLKNKMNRLLASPALRLPLERWGISLTDISSPKQTDTTQRWKMGLLASGHSVPLRTKVEFSRRNAHSLVGAALVEPMNAALAREYQVPPPLIMHYGVAAALEQKVAALVGRAQTQARDVFDIQLLLSRAGDARTSATIPTTVREAAIARVRSRSYDEYTGQVLAYLVPEQAAPFRGNEVWVAMQDEVARFLEGARS
ncbi:MAG: nucleotidyl transferase AbiEii/AbiGii toxin family protein [Myxococcaceae bacterium]